MSLVSVIIPNYNHGQFLEKRIETVLSQSFSDFETIILDDCSTDNSIEIIEKYKNHPKVSKIVLNDINSGSTFKQWKKGIELAKGKYIWIAESDDYSDLFFLQKCISIFQTYQDLSLVYTNSNIIDHNVDSNYIPHSISPANIVMDGKHAISNFLAYGNRIPNASSVVIKKEKISPEFIDKLSSFIFTGDWFMWLSLLKSGSVFFIDEKLNFFRRHQKSVTINNKENIKTTIEEIYPEINKMTKNLNLSLKDKLNIKKHWITKLSLYYKSSRRFNFLYFKPLTECFLLHLALPVYVTYKKIKPFFVK